MDNVKIKIREDIMKYFKLSEFECPCCGENYCDENLMNMLDAARGIAGVPFVITSGYRCWDHHKEIYRKLGKPVLRNSPHLKGFGADIAITSDENRWKIMSALKQVGFTRMGIGFSLIHVDNMPGKGSPRLWTYKY